ncbi:DegV family protein [Tissierella creatinini]|nr:DegV family protein [Tissierella creatinini]TJX66064.1 DegV family protein [Soehngenia saccharolytica]
MKYKIVADSSCDLNEDLKNRMEVSLVPFKINIDSDSYIDDENIDVYDMIDKMKVSPNPIKTSCPSPADFAAEYKDAENVFVVTISEQLSETYNSAILAKDMIMEEFKDKFIHVFNSKSASIGETLVAFKIKECIDEKLSNNQIVEKVEKFIGDMKTYFISEDLGNLIKNGRILKTKGLIINALNIKPIMGANSEGNIELVDKARGSKKAFKMLVDIIGDSGVKFEERILAISHANALQKAIDLKDDLKHLNFKEILIVETKGLSTAYVNDGGIIIAF